MLTGVLWRLLRLPFPTSSGPFPPTILYHEASRVVHCRSVMIRLTVASGGCSIDTLSRVSARQDPARNCRLVILSCIEALIYRNPAYALRNCP